jgi:hypothetical protein
MNPAYRPTNQRLGRGTRRCGSFGTWRASMSDEPPTANGASITPEQGGTRSVTFDEQAAAEVQVDEHLSHRARAAGPVISLAIDMGSVRTRARLTPSEARQIAEQLEAVAATAERRAREATGQD